MGVTVAPTTTSPSDSFEVMRANWPSVSALLACETQWRGVAGADGRLVWTGLDYAAVDVVLRRQRADDAVFGDLRVMEAEALQTFRGAA